MRVTGERGAEVRRQGATARRGAFGESLALARARACAGDASGPAEPAGGVLRLRRTGANTGEQVLSRRRREGEDGRALQGEQRALDLAPVTARLDASEVAPAAAGPARVDVAAAVEKLTLTFVRQERSAGPSLEMSLGDALRVRLTQDARGVRILVEGEEASTRLAAAELPRLVEKLRGRGVQVSRAEVRVKPR